MAIRPPRRISVSPYQGSGAVSDRKVRQTLLPVVSYSSSAGFRECRGRLPHLGGETAPGAGAHAPSDGAVPARSYLGCSSPAASSVAVRGPGSRRCQVGVPHRRWPFLQSSSGEPSARPATAPMTIQKRTLPNAAPTATPRPNAVALGSTGGSGHDHHGLAWRPGRLWPVAMRITLEREVAHLALDHPRQGAQPARGQQMPQHLSGRLPCRPGQPPRGKTRPGWSPGAARCAGCG
jgi:hypothetical protein